MTRSLQGDGGYLPITAAVLAGGRSLRMGSNKILLPVDGVALVTRAVQAVAAVCARVFVVTDRPAELGGLGLPAGVQVLGDAMPDRGPLGGLAAALAATTDEWVLAVAADMPWIAPELIRAVWAARGQGLVVVPITDRGPEPLLALYHRDTLPMMQGALRGGRLGLRRLLSELPGLVVVSIDAVRAVDPGFRSFVNVNTADEFRRLREIDPADSGPLPSRGN